MSPSLIVFWIWMSIAFFFLNICVLVGLAVFMVKLNGLMKEIKPKVEAIGARVEPHGAASSTHGWTDGACLQPRVDAAGASCLCYAAGDR